MSKVADYLQDHIVGDISVSPEARHHFATDGSILQQMPQIVVAPKNEQDVRKVARFSWQLAERGRALAIVPRGSGTDMSGAAIGQAISLTFTPHMNQVLEFDDRKNTVVAEPGTNFGRLQHMLSFSHGRYIPAYPMSYEYSTIGGAVMTNAGGERSYRFGSINNYVQKLRVVLSNGELIETGRMSKREVGRKMGQPTFEGEIYRALDALLGDNEEIIKEFTLNLRSNVGYALKGVREKDGSIDLTPLIIGSQGTLGIVTGVTLSTEAYRPGVSYFLISLADTLKISDTLKVIEKHKPLAAEYFDSATLNLARQSNSGLFQAEVGEDLPAALILVELEPMSEKGEKKTLKKLEKQLAEVDAKVTVLAGEEGQEVAHRLKRLTHTLLSRRFASSQLVSGIDDASVPIIELSGFLSDVKELFHKNSITVITTGHIMEGVLHSYPLVDLTQLGDRQRLSRLIEAYYRLVMQHNGSVSAEHGDGRIRGTFLKEQVGDVLYDVMHKIKQIFDPYNILNPGVKIDVDMKAVTPLLRQNYDITQLYHH